MKFAPFWISGRAGNMTHDERARESGDSESTAYIGVRDLWIGQKSFGLSRADRRQHVYCVGKTGTGKTTLLRNLIVQDMYEGHGVGFIDPHGDLARDLLEHVPPWRIEDVVYFNPADLDHPIGFNLMQNVPQERRHRIASGLVGAMKAIWRDSWGPRLEYILYAAVAALLDCQNVSILGIQRMLVDRWYRRWVVSQCCDPVVKSYWVDEYDHYDNRFMREAISPIQNKVGQLLMSPPIRNVLGQVKRKVDPRFMMDNKRIFIANLSKGLLGEDKANLLGSLLVTSFELAALERIDVPEVERQDFFLFIDEFHNFTTDSFATILSEARKYRLGLTISHQYLEQVHERVRAAVFGNVGTHISFRVGQADARVLADEYGSGYIPNQFSGLGNYEVLVKQLSLGAHGEPFLGHTLPPIDRPSGRRERIILRSREKYASRKDVVEEKIRRWMER